MFRLPRWKKTLRTLRGLGRQRQGSRGQPGGISSSWTSKSGRETIADLVSTLSNATSPLALSMVEACKEARHVMGLTRTPPKLTGSYLMFSLLMQIGLLRRALMLCSGSLSTTWTGQSDCSRMLDFELTHSPSSGTSPITLALYQIPLADLDEYTKRRSISAGEIGRLYARFPTLSLSLLERLPLSIFQRNPKQS